MNIYLATTIICAVSLAATWLVRRITLAKNLLDIPNQRSSHATSTPRGGGIAIIVSFVVGLIYLWSSDLISTPFYTALIGATIAVAIIGLWDDFGQISQKWRLAIHVFAAVWALYWLEGPVVLPLFGFVVSLGGPIGLTFLTIALVWILNLYNFMDGIDGLASSEAIFISLGGLFLLNGFEDLSESGPQLFLAASCLGFLFWNCPPAKIFMGDVASGSLGIILGLFALNGSVESSSTNLWAWLILFGLFFVDATFTLIRRMLQKQKWYSAHCSHAYQHAARKWGHSKTTGIATIINILWLLPMAWLATKSPSYGPLLTLTAFTPLIVLEFMFDAGKEINN